jgi:hypothetical protein
VDGCFAKGVDLYSYQAGVSLMRGGLGALVTKRPTFFSIDRVTILLPMPGLL